MSIPSKQQILAIIERDDQDALAAAGWGAVRALLSLLPSADQDLRRRAAVALGRLARARAQEDPEKVRDLLRRLLWSLNDESGNSGLGVPEAVAAIITGRPDLWAGYVGPLLARLDEAGLREGVTAAADILAASQLLIQEAAPVLEHLAADPDPEVQTAALETAIRMGLKI